MKRLSGLRKAANLSESVHHQLNMYTLGAGAGGVSMAALAQPAEAKIVYAPVNIPIGQGVSVQVDLNHDGISDFRLWNTYHQVTTFSAVAIFGATPDNPSNQVLCTASGWARALPKNARIASTGAFATGSRYMALVGHDYNRLYGGGPWAGNTRAYLGLKFQIGGKTHFGWARLHVTALVVPPLRHPLVDATLSGYAYETIPGKAIKAGQTEGSEDNSIEQVNPAALAVPTPAPATLGALARGTPGLSIWRRKEIEHPKRPQTAYLINR
jgi:hypothetical protein